MVKSVEPQVLETALKTWNSLKQEEDYETKAGTLVMKFLFEKCPKAKPMFGYDLMEDVENLVTDPKFVAHSKHLIKMFDMAFTMMGPDGNLLTEKIKELGEKHVAYGVQAEMFPIMGKALANMLQVLLGDAFTEEDHASWKLVFSAISQDLMMTVLKHGSRRDAMPERNSGNGNPVAA